MLTEMRRMIQQIKSYIQLHTSEIETQDYVAVLREIAEWAASQADVLEYGESLSDMLEEE